ncbi:hypothetical protein HDU93_004119, partial [Gonapodya sp. JEL0774]
ADGGHAEFVAIPDNAVAIMPDGIVFAKSAPLMCGGVTVFNGLRNTMCGPEMWWRWRAWEAGYHNIAISGSDAKRDLALKLGEHSYIDSSKQDPVAELKKLGGAKIRF